MGNKGKIRLWRCGGETVWKQGESRLWIISRMKINAYPLTNHQAPSRAGYLFQWTWSTTVMGCVWKKRKGIWERERNEKKSLQFSGDIIFLPAMVCFIFKKIELLTSAINKNPMSVKILNVGGFISQMKVLNRSWSLLS